MLVFRTNNTDLSAIALATADGFYVALLRRHSV